MATHVYGMGKIHPAVPSTKSEGRPGLVRETTMNRSSSVWTVWKKSSMAFQGTDGFSVYDDEGRLAFRVDNYSRKHREVVLMDGAGRALLTLRPQVLSMHDQWNAFTSDDDDTLRAGPKSKIFSMRRRRRSLLHGSRDDEVEVFVKGGGTTGSVPDFRVEGRFWQRSCKIRSNSGDVVARISRKMASKTVVLGDDVFSLVVEPGGDRSLIMAFVVVMDRICPKPYAPMLCS